MKCLILLLLLFCACEKSETSQGMSAEEMHNSIEAREEYREHRGYEEGSYVTQSEVDDSNRDIDSYNARNGTKIPHVKLGVKPTIEQDKAIYEAIYYNY